MQQIELVLFDLDGTLVDTATDVHISLNIALEKMGLPTISRQIAKKAIGPGPQEFIKHILLDRVDLEEEFRQIFRSIYWERCADNAEPFDGIVELLQELKDKNIKAAVATNKSHQGTDAVLKALELEFYFDVILSRDQVEHPKPAPDMVLEVCQLLNISPRQSMFIGDTDNDILASNAAGVKSCLALWGYSDHFNELKKISTYAVEHPLQVLDIIESEIFQHA